MKSDKRELNLRYLYSVLFYLALPFILLRLLWRSRRIPGNRHNIAERFGFCPQQTKNTLWIHTVSVGETIAAIPLIKALKNAYPQLPILMTNMTATGAARVKATWGDSVMQAYIPYDTPDAVARFLDRARPKMAIILETELWPNLFAACRQRDIPIMITNARLSEKSAKGYQRVLSITREMLSAVTILAAQSKIEGERFIKLGLKAEKLSITGNLKFDLDMPVELAEKGQALKKQLGENRPIWIAASTHAGEEEIILAAHRLVLEKIPSALLILVPRHPDRFNQVAELIEQQGFKMARRSLGVTDLSDKTVYLGDTMGELLLLYSAVDVAFVGGSLIQVGGHNILEPAALSKPIISGPILFNFTEISEKMLNNNALLIAETAAEIANKVQKILLDPEYRKQLGDNARYVVDENRGALQKQLHLACSLLGDQG